MSNRIQKVNSLLERQIGKIIQCDIFLPDGTMATLTHVEATANLIEAKVYISVFPEEKFDEVMVLLKKEIYNIQKEINKKLNMRPIPKIIFVKDKIISQAGKIDELLNKIKQEEDN